jgi:hypothetical protein
VQRAQARSRVADGAADAYSAAAQGDHVAHDVAPAPAKVPAAHGAHAVAPVPSVDDVPAGHGAHVNDAPLTLHAVPPRHGEPAPAQTPDAQASTTVHALSSEQALPVVGPHAPFDDAPAATLHA